MFVVEIALALRRWWWVALVVVLTVAGLTAYFARDSGLYFTRTVVTFSGEDEQWAFQEGGSRDAGIITFTAAVAQEINGGVEPVHFASADAPYFGSGVRQGVLVSVPDTGGQWVTSYQRAAIEIQIVSPDYGWVKEQQSALVSQVQAIATAQEGYLNPHGERWVSLAVDPLALQIEHIAPSRTSWALAIAAMSTVAILVSGVIAVSLERRRRIRRPGSAGVARKTVVEELVSR
jgi:hypothetical protein